MREHDTRNRLTPTCPHCGHAMTDDDMCTNAYRPGDDCDDLWALPTREERTPRYTSAISEDEL